ncbi:hypothetical protein HY968_01385 [Candidatus Kaiserbacteria bacterium]|nr:hypothetical protein [Candidatus Kaiserbacteria bacterium]
MDAFIGFVNTLAMLAIQAFALFVQFLLAIFTFILVFLQGIAHALHIG